MKTFLNYLGQFRIYSLIDLIILLFAAHAGIQDFFGIIFLHLGFIAYLETIHSHTYRKKIPKYLWIVLEIIGIVLYRHLEVILFILCSYFYVKKNKKHWGCAGPIFRGLQYFFLIDGIIGYTNQFTWIVLLLVFVRNFTGDLRDVVKDKKENIKTLPIIMGLSKDIKYIHLFAMLSTTFIWFQYTNNARWLIIPIFLIQILTYRITPR